MSIKHTTGNSGSETNQELTSKVELAAKIFDKYGDKIRAMIRREVNDYSMADDIFQDLFLSFVHRPISPDIPNMCGYICKAIKHDLYDANRRKKSYHSLICKYTEDRIHNILHEDPQNALIKTEEAQKIFEVSEKLLLHHEADAIIQKYGRDHDAVEAANEMKIKRRSYSRYLCVGLKKLRKSIGNYMLDELGQ